MSTVSPPTSQEHEALDRLMKVLWAGAAFGLLALLLATAAGLPVPQGTAAAIGIGILIFLAAFSTGALLGFLFGVPRAVSRETLTAPAPQADSAAAPLGAGPAMQAPAHGPGGAAAIQSARRLQSNTNLEKISDWLTTLLVGAGLAQLHNVGIALQGFVDFLEASATVFVGTDGRPSAGMIPIIGPLLLIFGAVCGFLYMYLNTRLVLVRVFNLIERLLDNDERLTPNLDRAVKALVMEEGSDGGFVQRQFAAKSRLTVDDALNLMFDLLYKSDPQRVIDLGTELAGTEAGNRPDYWFYMAAAFGQRMSYLEPGSDEWKRARADALDCARRAVALDPHYRARLWAISDPAGYDNDLAPLREDIDFLRIVGRDGGRSA